jgi:hypothetical protein
MVVKTVEPGKLQLLMHLTKDDMSKPTGIEYGYNAVEIAPEEAEGAGQGAEVPVNGVEIA